MLSKIIRVKLSEWIYIYILPITIITVIILYYFKYLFPLNGILAYNDYVLPQSLGDLNEYLSNWSIYNITSNLGGMRINFFSELPTLLILKFFSIFTEYSLAAKLTQISSFWMVAVSFYLIFYRICKGKLPSLIVALLTVFNFWSLDRLQQGHYYLLGPFLVIFGITVYLWFFSNKKYKIYIIPHLLFLSVFFYYHYALILLYTLAVDAIIRLITTKDKIIIFKQYLIVLCIFVIDMAIYIMPYSFGAFNSFQSLSNQLSTQNELQIFAWQSTSLSEIFHIRKGMYSFKFIQENDILLKILSGFLILYILYLYRNPHDNDNNYIYKRINLLFIFLGFLGFGIWLNFDFFQNYIYKIPTFATFRDMNKFVGISFIYLLFIIILKFKTKLHNFFYYFLIILITIVLLVPQIKPYEKFLVYNKDEIYEFPRDLDHQIISFPSYPLVKVEFNGSVFHKYLPTLVATNNFRSISIPFRSTTESANLSYTIYRYIYENFTNLTQEDIFRYISKYGIDYILIYKRYDYKTFDPNINLHVSKLDFNAKISDENKIYENNDILIFKVPEKYFNKIIYLQNGKSEYTKISNSLFLINTFDKSSLNFITNFDPNWQLYNINENFDNSLWSQLSIELNLLFYNDSKLINHLESERMNNWPDLPAGKYLLSYKPNRYYILGMIILVCSLSFSAFKIYGIIKKK